MIEVSDLAVSIGRKRILEGVGFTAVPGEITAIIGPNGSGKSTLLKAICGDLKYEGRIAINNIPLSDLKPWQAATLRAVLPQSSTLSFPYTVREVVNIGLTSGSAGVPLGELRRLPDRALARVDLEGFAGRLYQELSGGEQQRVQLARTLCQVWQPTHEGQPRFLLLDEPVSSLDIRHQIGIMSIARDFAVAGGGVIAILHDLNLTAMFADRVLVLHEGRTHGWGTPAEIIVDGVLAEVFGTNLRAGVLPPGNVPFVLPQSVALG